jgi:hypothetical protein
VKALISILFSIALVWTQTAFTATSDAAAAPREQTCACPCEKPMACCVPPTSIPAPQPIPATPTRTAERENLNPVLSVIAAALKLPTALASGASVVSPLLLPKAAPLPLYTRHCSYLI